MEKPILLPRPSLLVLRQLRAGGSRQHAYQIAKATGLTPATVGQMVTRWARDHWVEAEWEDEEAAATQGRRPRRYLTLTPLGVALALEAERRLRWRPDPDVTPS